jgi:hypothetical protein
MSAAGAMVALQTILPTSTTIATAVVQKGLDTAVATFPAIIINCPTARQDVRTIGAGTPTQWTHHIHVLYLDRWESSSRDLEGVMVDADTALDQMVSNARANPTLLTSSTPHCAALGVIEKKLDGPVHDEGLGFPLVSGQLVLEVKDFWY